MEYLKFSYILIRPKAKAKDVFLKLSKVLKDIKMSLVPKYNEVTLYRSRKRWNLFHSTCRHLMSASVGACVCVRARARNRDSHSKHWPYNCACGDAFETTISSLRRLFIYLPVICFFPHAFSTGAAGPTFIQLSGSATDIVEITYLYLQVGRNLRLTLLRLVREKTVNAIYYKIKISILQYDIEFLTIFSQMRKT